MNAMLRTRGALAGRLLNTPSEDWRADAACVDYDAELWFPLSSADESGAISICRACPVIANCRAWADQLGKVEGIWAGETEEARRLRRNRKRDRRRFALRICAECGAEHYGPRHRYCSETCYLLSRLAKSTRRRIRQEART